MKIEGKNTEKKKGQSPQDRIKLVYPEMSMGASVAEAQQAEGKGERDRLGKKGLAGHTDELISLF